MDEDNKEPAICRTCMSKETELQSIFISSKVSDLNMHIAEMIMEFSSIQVTIGDGLPESICKICADKVVSLFLFKLQCERSDTILRSKFKNDLSKSEIKSLDESNNISRDNEEKNSKEIVQKSELDFYTSINFYDLKKLSDEKIKDSSNKDVLEYKCSECDKKFQSTSGLERHEKYHKKKYQCEECNKCFSRNEFLLKHKIAHAIEINKDISDDTNVSIDEIDSNDKEYNQELIIKINEEVEDKLISENKNLVCAICKSQFAKVTQLKRHMKLHNDNNFWPFECNYCGKVFLETTDFQSHLNVHIKKPYTCRTCFKGFSQNSNLKDHMRIHTGEKPYLCSICGKGFNQLGNLRQHTNRHSEIKAHLCSTCGTGFSSKGELLAHNRRHTGSRPFVCPVCSRAFTTSSSLTKHKRIHSGEKPYECTTCHMRFSRSGILTRHMRIHTGVKPYVCTYCKKAFSQSNDLNCHMRIHTGEKPYICDVCGQAFRQSSALKTHKRTHSNNQQKIEKDEIFGVV